MAVGRCKTEVSSKLLPLDRAIAEELRRWKQITPYPKEDDWMWASPFTRGIRPYWPESLLKRHFRPAVNRAGITKRIGFHSFRHSLSTLLKGNGEDVKTVQELLRHANSRITLDTYTQALSSAKREAQGKVVRAILANKPSSEPSRNC
jgi:integrase